MIITTCARAYVNHGRWVADCPAEDGAAVLLAPRQGSIVCPKCYAIWEIEWPSNPDEIMNALEKRANPQNRNWYPIGHVLALRGNKPHGQSVADLLEEQQQHEEE